MKFTKKRRQMKPLVYVWGYFLIRKFKYSNSKELVRDEILNEFLKTNYVLHNEQRHDFVTVSVNHKNITTDWNFYGLYDIKKVSISCFDEVDFEEFQRRFIGYINRMAEDYPYYAQVEKALSKYNLSSNQFLIIRELPEAYKHEWSVFLYFISCIVYNERKRRITLIEFGLD